MIKPPREGDRLSRTATRLRWEDYPRSWGGGHARSEPSAPPVTGRQPAWQGRKTTTLTPRSAEGSRRYPEG